MTTSSTPDGRPDGTETGRATVRATLVGGPTVLLEYAGLRVLSDPTFDTPRSYDGGVALTRTTAPAVRAEDVLPVDLVLVSHDQHPDNLDVAGREVVATTLAAGHRVLSTPTAANRIPGVTGLEPWERNVPGHASGAPAVSVTAVPALHGPDGAEAVVGPVTGFVLEAAGWPTVYVSGDNASVDLVHEIAERFTVGVAVLHVGAADTGRFPGATLTLRGTDAARVSELLPDAVVVPVHADSWAHFTESVDDVRAAFDAAGVGDRLQVLAPAERTDLRATVRGA